jgi:hypothetical protein
LALALVADLCILLPLAQQARVIKVGSGGYLKDVNVNPRQYV